MAAGAAKGRKGFDGHPVDSRSAFVCPHPFPGASQDLPIKDLLHHGLFLRAPILLSTRALALTSPAGFIGLRILRGIVALLIGSALHGIEVDAPPSRLRTLRVLLRKICLAASAAARLRFRVYAGISSPRLVVHYYGLC
jgi:hypothetical protein